MFRLLLIYLTINNRVPFTVTKEVFNGAKELKNAPPDHIIPYSTYEDPVEPSTKPKYIAPGKWARPPSNKSAILEFVPTRLYAQVRQRHIRKNVPREDALKEATNDEERENAARLKEVVTKRKVNTVYTEEGYEDAAYDHGGHIRDANINENYSSKDHMAKDLDEINDDDGTVTDPKLIIDKEVLKLERDLDREDSEVAQGAETEIPENLHDLTDDSVTDDYEDNQESKSSTYNYDYENNNSEQTTSTDLYSKNFEEAVTNMELANIPISLKNPQLPIDTLYPVNSSIHDFTPTFKYLSSSEDKSPLQDSSRVFWDYFKTDKTITLISTTETPKNTEHQIASANIELQKLTAPEDPMNETHVYPSLSQIYENWKQRGIKKNGSEILDSTTSTEDDSAEINIIKHTPERKVKKRYMIMIRDRKKSDDDEVTKYSAMDFATTELPLKHVTYTHLLRDTYDNFTNPIVTQEGAWSMEQTIPDITPHSSTASDISSGDSVTTPPIYRYHQLQQRHHYHHLRPLVRRNHKRPILSLIKMLPPSRISRSEYAQYYSPERSGNTKSNHDSGPDIYKKYQSGFYSHKKALHRIKRFSTIIDKGPDSKKVSMTGVNINYQRMDHEKLDQSRRRRYAEELLVKAPRVVDEIIDKEIELRFSDTDKYNDSKANNSASFGSKPQNEVKVEIEIPEYNFPDVFHVPNDDEMISNIPAPQTRSIDREKYPFHNDNQIPHASPLRYAINPLQVPQKTHGELEFYNSRDKYMNCDDIERDISEVLPEEDEPVTNGDIKENLPRLRNLGDKLSCLRDKYFDKEPFDNPLFQEKLMDAPKIPNELDPTILKLIFSNFLSDREAKVARHISRKPEIIDLTRSNSRKVEINSSDFENNTENNLTVRDNHAKKYRHKYRLTTVAPDALYQRQVYEDVMGTIRNMAQSYHWQSELSKPLKISHIVNNANPNINYSSKVARDHNVNDQSIRITTRPNVTLPRLTVPQIVGKYKIRPYRTNRVSYVTRPRVDPILGTNVSRTVSFFKTVRVHKRSVDTSNVNVNKKISDDNNLAKNATGRRQMRRITSTITPDSSTQSLKRVVYTIDNHSKYLKPRGQMRYRELSTGSTTLNKDTKRGEPRYTSIRKFDDNVYNTTDSNNQNVDTNARKNGKYDIVIGRRREQINKRNYAVREEIDEELPAKPIITENKKYEKVPRTLNSDYSEGSGQSEELSKSSSNEEEIKDDRYDEEVTNEGANDKNTYDEQIEKSNKTLESENSKDESDALNDSDETSYETPPSHNEEKNISHKSEGEVEFERFSSRPYSPFESNFDKKYSHLGPRINKPSFYHSSFDSPKPRNSLRYRQQHQDTLDKDEESRGASKHVFPWQQDDIDASEESRRYEKCTGMHKYPWERRERFLRLRKPSWNDDYEKSSNEQSTSGTAMLFKNIYPWERYNVPSKPFGFGTSTYFFSPMSDSYEFNSELHPLKYSSRYRSKPWPFRQSMLNKLNEKSITNDTNSNYNNMAYTTFRSQIPATSATFMSSIKDTTTPSMTIKPLSPVNTIESRPRFFRTITPAISTVTSRPVQSRGSRRREQSIGVFDNHEKLKNVLEYKKNHRKSRMIVLSTTLKPSPDDKSVFQMTKDISIIPTTMRNVEHRSKISKVEKITKITFPNSQTSDRENENLPAKIKTIQKVSIVTKKTPEHVYHTKEIDNDGIKDTFITILPNNNTQKSLEWGKSM